MRFFNTGGADDGDLSTIFPEESLDSGDSNEVHILGVTASSCASVAASAPTRVVDHRTRADDEDRREEDRLRRMYLGQMPTKLVDETTMQRARERALSDSSGDDDDASSSGSELSIPPPPPPTTTTSMFMRARGIVCSGGWSSRPPPGSPKGTEVTSGSDDGSPKKSEPVTRKSKVKGSAREAWIIEQDNSIESLDVSKWPPYWNRMNLSDSVASIKVGLMQRIPEKIKDTRLRWLWVLGAAVILLCLIIGISVGVSNKNKKKSSNSATSSVAFRAPTTAPTVASSFLGGDEAVASATDPPAVEETQDSCEDMVKPDRLCYTTADLASGTPIFVAFVRCDPLAENWVGIYPAGLDELALPDPESWLWTCNSQDINDCNVNGTKADVLQFEDTLDPGFYQAHFVDTDGSAPFEASIVSSVFQISDDCSK